MDKQRHGGGAAGQMVIGLGVIAVGMLFLLDNLGIIDFVDFTALWPVLLIMGGVLKYLQSTSGRGKAAGIVLAALGAVLLLRAVGLIDISWRLLMPGLMIAGGMVVVFQAMRSRTGGDARPGLYKDGDSDSDSHVRLFALLGGIDRRVQTSDFRGGEVSAFMGGCQLDLREASVQGEAVINVFAMWGGIDIRVPDDWVVSLEGVPLLGGFSENTKPLGDRNKRLVIRGVALMGGVEVRN